MPTTLSQSTVGDGRLDGLVGPGGELEPAEPEAVMVSMFDECHDGVYRYIRTFGHDRSASEDLTQDVFLALLRHLVRGRARINLRGWVFRVAHNLALKRRQREHHWLRIATVLAPVAPRVDPAPNAEEQLVANARHVRLRAALEALPERDRQCVTLRAEGLSYREIAGALGVSVGTVANRLASGLGRLARVDER